MGIFNQVPDNLEEVDVIIAGGEYLEHMIPLTEETQQQYLQSKPIKLILANLLALLGGTAGCVVASRLSDADPDLSILVIEGGRDNHNDPTVVHPVLFLSHLMPTSKTTLFYKGKPEKKVENRQVVVASGGVLGGGSSINIMTYSRAQRQDFDAWKTPGWSADDLLPYMKKLETYHGPGSEDTHGKDGPIHVSRGTFNVARSEEDFLRAVNEVGIPTQVDIQNLDTNQAAQRNMRYISPEGRRQDAAHSYLHPRLRDGRHENLHVLVEHQVVRVLIENKRAIGVECRPNPAFQSPSTSHRIIKARKMVVISAGALGSPLILERSGVGDPEVLRKAGVPVQIELPGVGRNYMDHHLLTFPYRSSLEPAETVDAMYGGRQDMGEMIATNDSMLGWNAADVTAKVRPTDAEAAALGPEFLEAWNKEFKDNRNKPLAILTSLNGFPGDPTGLPSAQFMSCSTFTVYPYSRGQIHITGKDIDAPYDFETGFLSDAHDLDLKKSVWAYKKQREIMRRMNVYRGEYAPGHPSFSAGSDAASVELDGPLGDVGDIAYTPEDDAVIERWIRLNVGTTWHSLGTCKMAPRSEGGVVDASLGVHGIEGLRVADLSIPPQNVAANTCNTALIIGEKAADIFIKELGLSS
ncbi:hypothetical protein HIM_01072 [Hirsutella minnesotensis 3608]|nr:hypothetical protein HIM_01072 [Hirsutella minnesotensis 3608]